MDLDSLIFEQLGDTDNASDMIKEETTKDIAVIGIAARLPMAENIEMFWNNLIEGRDCVDYFPKSRQKDADVFAELVGINKQSKEYNVGAYFEDIDKFDYSFFRISPKEASLMSPEQRIFLETVWKAVEDAGYGNGKLKGSCTGVYFGYSADALFDYKRLIEKVNPELLIDALPGNLSSIIPSRISYLLDLKGPSICVDTACSSSLVAVHMACKALRSKECDVAIAGSVKINILPVKSSKKLGIESSDGRARTFDDSADGTGMGEGVAAVILKPLHRALRDGDNIYAVIKGTVANQDGNCIGITAPNAQAQRDVIIAALEDAGIDAETVSYIEAHGTGTELGDPIEIDGITKAFRKYTDKKQFCAIGSVKTNIGHLDCASGIIGLIKSVLSLKYKKLPPSLHFERPNRKIDFEESPVYVNNKLSDWNNDFPRRCGVSAFGLSGTNCHIILEEAPQNDSYEKTEEIGSNILTLSAKNENSLKQLVIKYNEFIKENTAINLSDMCYSANTGRWHYNIRLAIVFDNKEELTAALNKLINEGLKTYAENGIYFSEKATEQKSEHLAFDEVAAASTIEALNNTSIMDRSVLNNLCKEYVSGNEIDFSLIYKNITVNRIRLPEYPFERKRCWINVPENSSIADTDTIIQAMKRDSKLMEQIKKLIDSQKGEREEIFTEYTKENAEGFADEKSFKLLGKEDGIYSDTEILMGNIWCKALGYDEIDINDDFYELGGDSIIAIQIANEYKKITGFKIDVENIMEHYTISSLAAFVDSNDNKSHETQLPSIVRVEERDYYPLSSAQKRMYVINKFEGIGNSYNMPMAISIEGSLNIGRLKCAVKEIVNRHDAFRMSFHIRDNTPVMIVDKEVDFEIDELECSDPDQLPSLLKSFVKPFDLQKAPLFRSKIIKINDMKHVLFVDMHHIVTDGMSSVIFDKELVQLYLGKELKEPDVQYADYAVWQNMQLNSDNMKKQEEYWLKKFEGEIPVLELPTDFQRPSIQSFEGDRVIFEADNDLSERILKLAEKTGTTLYMVLMSVYKILLSKYTGQDEIIVASPITDRKMEELQNVIGMFVNTVVLWSNPSSEKTFVQYLQEVKQIALEAFANSDYPFEDLINKINIKRDMSRTPLFDTMLTLQNTEKLKLEAEGLKFGQIGFENNISKFDLNLNISVQDFEDGKKVENSKKIIFDMEYCTKLFRRETVERLVKHFINIFDIVTKNPDIFIKDINMMSENEQKLLISTFNNTSFEYPKNTVIHKLLEENAIKNPDGIAVEIGEKKISYYELNRRADCIAKILREKGINKEDIVAISTHRSLELIIGIMGILKSGAAYLPMDPINPDGRIEYMIKDSGAKMILTLSEYLDRLEKLQIGIDIINLEEQELYIDNSEKLDVSVDPSNAAYVIYTSGSTGKPKGVIVEHHSLMNFLFCINNTFDTIICSKDKGLSLTSISFDVSVCELFLPLAFGATLVLFDELMVSDIRSLCRTLIEKEITFAYIPPTILWEVSQQLMKNKDSVKLNKMLVGVEGIKDYVLEEFIKLNPEISIINGYGPTEDTICATFYKYKSHHPVGKNVPIGKPLANTRIYILDKDNNIVPTGVIGELCISGDGLARGYLNSPEMTAEKFVLNPFYSNNECHMDSNNDQHLNGQCTSEIYKRMYRTGDLAKWLPDGNIEFSGRKDYQVKIRGYRIELGEIESCLLKHEQVKDVVVTVREDNNGLKSLTAYIVSDSQPDISELKKHLSRELPDYMVPSFFVMLDSIPMTANGKVDRNALPEPDRTVGTGTQYIAPANITEEKLVSLWQDILALDKVGVNDRFFDLGGDSIKAIQVVSFVNQEFNMDLPASKLYSNPTVREIAEFIDEYTENVSITEKTEESEQDKIVDISDEMQQLDIQIDETSDVDTKNKSLVCGKRDGYPVSMEHEIILQREFTTYLHRSLPLCAILPYEKYKPWFYSSFIQIFGFIDRSGGLFIDFMEPCRCPIEVMHVVNLAYHLLKHHRENIIDFIVDKINLGYCLTIFVDEYYLPNKWAYKKQHFVHSSMIYGYDNEKKQLKAIGFDQNMIFQRIVFDYDEFQEAYESGKIHYKETAPWCELSAISLIRQNNFDEEFPFSNAYFLSEIRDYLLSKGDYRRLYAFMYSDHHAVFGMKVYDAAIQNLKNLFIGKATIDYRAMHFIWEHKKGIYDRIAYVISRNNLTGEITRLHKEYLKVVELSNNLRLKSLELENSNIRTEGLSENLKNLIENILQLVEELKNADFDILSRIYKQLVLDLNIEEEMQINKALDICVNEAYVYSKQVIESSEGLLLNESSELNAKDQLTDNSLQVQKKNMEIEYMSHIGTNNSNISLFNKSTEYPQMLELKVEMQTDITTYLHRSLPLCVVLAYDKYLPWYYSRFIQVFSYTDDNGVSEINYLEPRDCSSEIMEMVCLGYHLLDKVDNIIDFIIEKINMGFYLIISVDEYYLSNKWAYNKTHFVHSSLIYGYDNETEELKAIGFNKDMFFTMMTFEYAQFLEAYNNGKIHYKESSPWCDTSAIQIVRPNSFEAEYPFSNERFMRELSSYIFSVGDGDRLYTFEYSSSRVVYGIKVYDVLLKDLESLLQGKNVIDYRGIHLLAEHKKGIYKRLEYIISKNKLTGDIIRLKESYLEVVSLANSIRLVCLEFSYKNLDITNNKNSILDFIEMVKKLKATEYDILLQIYRQLELDLKRENVKIEYEL